MRTPIAQIRARGIDTFWTATLREKAQGHLATVREALWRAEWYFDLASEELAAGGKHSDRVAADWIDLAFRWIETGQASKRYAKDAALLATRGTPLESWAGKPAGRAERRRIVLEYP